MGTQLSRFKDRAKKLLARTDKQAQKESQQLIDRMVSLGLLKSGATFDDILGLSIKDVMERRLQTLLIKKMLARTPKQARQMITHRHVTLKGQVVTSPSYLVSVDEEPTITFVNRSAFVNEAHPERFSEEELLRKKQKEESKKQKVKAGTEEEAATFDPAAIEQAEVLSGEKKVESVKDAVKPDAEKAAPAEKSVEKVTEKAAPAETSEEKPAEKAAPEEKAAPVEKSAEKPAEKEAAVEKSEEKPTEKAAPAETPTEEPAPAATSEKKEGDA
jgi:small subunit ribosomal protein S4